MVCFSEDSTSRSYRFCIDGKLQAHCFYGEGKREILPLQLDELTKTITPLNFSSNVWPSSVELRKEVEDAYEFFCRPSRWQTDGAQSFSEHRQLGENPTICQHVHPGKKSSPSFSVQKERNRRILMHDMFSCIVGNMFCTISHDRTRPVPPSLLASQVWRLSSGFCMVPLFASFYGPRHVISGEKLASR